MKLLLTGASGKLGRELKKLLPKAYAPSHKHLDITDREKVFKYVKHAKIDTIIHCAALTSIRYCETHREEAYRVNVLGTRNLVEALHWSLPETYFIYVSTACVFHGDESNYSETNLPYPKNYYGLTKLLAETIVAEKRNTLVIRTNFITRDKWPYPEAFVNRYANYLYADQLATAIKKILEEEYTGIVHVCGDKTASMFDFARLTTPEIKPVTTWTYNGPPVTVNMTLKSNRIKHVHFEGKL